MNFIKVNSRTSFVKLQPVKMSKENSAETKQVEYKSIILQETKNQEMEITDLKKSQLFELLKISNKNMNFFLLQIHFVFMLQLLWGVI